MIYEDEGIFQVGRSCVARDGSIEIHIDTHERSDRRNRFHAEKIPVAFVFASVREIIMYCDPRVILLERANIGMGDPRSLRDDIVDFFLIGHVTTIQGVDRELQSLVGKYPIRIESRELRSTVVMFWCSGRESEKSFSILYESKIGNGIISRELPCVLHRRNLIPMQVAESDR